MIEYIKFRYYDTEATGRIILDKGKIKIETSEEGYGQTIMEIIEHWKNVYKANDKKIFNEDVFLKYY